MFLERTYSRVNIVYTKIGGAIASLRIALYKDVAHLVWMDQRPRCTHRDQWGVEGKRSLGLGLPILGKGSRIV